MRSATAALISFALAFGMAAFTVEPASAARRSVATKAEFNRIQNGQTLNQVRKIIGSSGDMVDPYTYRWNSTGGRIVGVYFVEGRVADKERMVVASLSEYKKIKKGQGYSRVKNIIGGRSQFSYQDDDVRYRVWLSPDLSKIIVITFAHGKVIGKERISDEEAISFAAR